MIRQKLIVLAVLLCFDCCFANAQSSEVAKQLANELRDKVLTLRSFSRSNRLQFDAAGRLNDSSTAPVSWTMFSTFQVKSVELAPRRVRILGPRIVYHFDRNSRKLVPSRSNQNLEIDLETTDGLSAAEISAAITKILVGQEGLFPYVPVYWRRYLGNETAPKAAPEGFVDFRTDAAAWLDVQNGGAIPKPFNSGPLEQPKLVTTVRPQYSEQARQFLLEGLVVLEAQVSESGSVDKVEVVIPAGAGFDESAVDAVVRWKYRPLVINGKATPFVTTITVNYSFSR
jgi:TonB family protein